MTHSVLTARPTTNEELDQFLESFPKDDNYCGRNYHLWEARVLRALERFDIYGHFVTGDGDRFGPLTRVLKTDDGLEAWYG